MGPSPAVDPVSVLFVEDDETLAHMYRDYFAANGVNAAVASDGQQGLTAVETFKPDVVCLDLELPDLHGFQVLERLQQGNVQVPVLILSNHKERESRERCLRLGAVDYLVKGDLQPAEVLDRVLKTVSDQRRA